MKDKVDSVHATSYLLKPQIDHVVWVGHGWMQKCSWPIRLQDFQALISQKLLEL